jgi:CheY-like chemotaxis protein
MDEETLEKAVQPFFSTKGVGKGSGLGLSMIHGLASQLNGKLILTSKVGLGTKAELWIPATGDGGSEVDVPTPVSSPRPSDRSLRILFVDDDALISMSSVDMLEDLGHAVTPAYSGAQALELLRAGQEFDLLITDFSMPKMTGGDLALAVRALYPDLPILLATGYAELPSNHDLRLPRLAKPYLQSDLNAEIRKLFGQA